MRQSSKAQHAVHEHADLQLTYGVAVLMSWHACAFCNFHVQCSVPLLSRAKHKMFWRVCMSCIYACTAGDGTPTTGHTAELLGQGRHSWASERKQLNKGLAQISKSNSQRLGNLRCNHMQTLSCAANLGIVCKASAIIRCWVSVCE